MALTRQVDGVKFAIPIEEETEILASQAEAQKRIDDSAYVRARRKAYPDIRDFADAYYWAQKGDDSKMTSYVAACAKVKADNPK